jgi:hypothetical protein
MARFMGISYLQPNGLEHDSSGQMVVYPALIPTGINTKYVSRLGSQQIIIAARPDDDNNYMRLAVVVSPRYERSPGERLHRVWPTVRQNHRTVFDFFKRTLVENCLFTTMFGRNKLGGDKR